MLNKRMNVLVFLKTKRSVCLTDHCDGHYHLFLSYQNIIISPFTRLFVNCFHLKWNIYHPDWCIYFIDS